MLKQIENSEKRPNTTMNFNLIKSWVQRHLKQNNNLLSCNNQERKVTINTLSGEKFVEIPVKHSSNDKLWSEAWVKVYEICLDALEEKVRYLCFNDPLVTYVSGNKIKVGSKMITIPDNINDITYINTLETIINTYEIAKITEKKEQKQEQEQKTISIKHLSIQIEKPSLQTTMPDEENRVKSVRIPLEKSKSSQEIKQKHSNKIKQIVGQKISDGDIINKDDCIYFKENKVPFVLVTCTSLGKGDSVFIQNADLCSNENIPIGAFITGKATNQDQGIHETKKIIKLLKNYDINGPIIYEINNEEIKYSEPLKIMSIFDTALQILDTIKSEGYTPILCLDADVYKIIKEVKEELRPNEVTRHPHILRILPREKEDIEENESTILMEPVYDYDIVTIKGNI